ncbi:MAG TPA: histidine phosphatase family protein [Cellvibrionaceae bacterium]
MKLWILRHGKAEPYAGNDAERALTDHGQGEVRAVLERQYNLIDHSGLVIWSSPFVRARQSAAIARDILGAPITEYTELLQPEAQVDRLLNALYQSGLPNVLLASHQPLVSTLLDRLCGPADIEHEMKTASLAFVECEVAAADMGKLGWLVHP